MFWSKKKPAPTPPRYPFLFLEARGDTILVTAHGSPEDFGVAPTANALAAMVLMASDGSLLSVMRDAIVSGCPPEVSRLALEAISAHQEEEEEDGLVVEPTAVFGEGE